MHSKAMVIGKMVHELNFPIEIVRVPIVREADGLAKSSRNVYLDAEQRKRGPGIEQGFGRGSQPDQARGKRCCQIKRNHASSDCSQPQANIDYVEIYDAADLRRC